MIPDLDVKKYLQSVIYRKFNVVTGILENGGTIEVFREGGERPQIGMKVTIDGCDPEDGNYKSSTTNIIYELKNAKIHKLKFLKKHQCKGIVFEIEQYVYYSVEIGDYVYIDKKPTPSGKYKIAFMEHIIVDDGVIVAKSLW